MTPNSSGLVAFLGGAVALAYLVAGFFFLRFWMKTKDRLFLHFAIAFWLFTFNQLFVSFLDMQGERAGYVYILRVLGFIVILAGILDKNASPNRRRH